MKVPELFNHLKYFKDEDYKDFEKYLKSPFFNSIKSYDRIFRIITKNMQLVKDGEFKVVRDLVVKEMEYSENTTLKLLSELGEQVLNYFRVKAVNSKTLNKEMALCESMLSKGYYKIVPDVVESCYKILDEDNPDEDKYLDYFQLNYISYRASVITESKFYGDFKITEQQEYTLQGSMNLFVFSLARLTINFLNFKIQNIDSSIKSPKPYPIDLKPMFNIINRDEFKYFDKHQKALIVLYHKLFLMYSDILNDNAYNEYKKEFYKIMRMFSNDFSVTHFGILMNYCTMRKRVKDVDLKYSEEGNKLLYEYIDKEIYKDEVKSYLMPVHYRNFVISCNTEGSKQLLKKFIDAQSKKLHPDHYKDMHNFALLHYYFLNKEYGKAIKTMIELKHPKIVYKYDIYSLELKIYYEKGDYEGLEKLLHNFYGNIKNENIFTVHDKERHELLVYYFRKLVSKKIKYDDDNKVVNLELFKKDIEKEINFVMKIWILSKLDELIENHKDTPKKDEEKLPPKQ